MCIRQSIDMLNWLSIRLGGYEVGFLGLVTTVSDL